MKLVKIYRLLNNEFRSNKSRLLNNELRSNKSSKLLSYHFYYTEKWNLVDFLNFSTKDGDPRPRSYRVLTMISIEKTSIRFSPPLSYCLSSFRYLLGLYAFIIYVFFFALSSLFLLCYLYYSRVALNFVFLTSHPRFFFSMVLFYAFSSV